jgi:threonine dehydratase
MRRPKRYEAASTAVPPIDPTPDHRLALADILDAQDVIDPVFVNSPQYDCEPLSAALGCRLTIKVETANPIRSFKGRGASLLIRNMTGAAPIVAASAGNWGQAVAYACREAKRRLVLYAAVNANPLKIERMRALGAEVRLHGDDFDAAKTEAEAFARASGLRMVSDGLDPEASIGAATMAVELLEGGASYDAVVVPLGNGAMLTGVGRWFKAASPKTQVIGVCARGADAMEKSWRTGRLVFPPEAKTIADGIGVRVPIAAAVADMKQTVDDVLLVDDDRIIAAMRLVFATAGILLEPAGAAGVAALMTHAPRFKSLRVATILCGGNATQKQINDWVLTRS